MSFRPLHSILLAVSALALPAQVSVTIAPRLPVLLAGQTLAFTARVLNTRQSQCLWSVSGDGATIGPDGVLTGAPGEYRVEATSVADSGACDSTTVLILPDHAALRTVNGVLGPGVLAASWSDALPFQDLAGTGRFGDPGAQVTELRDAGYAVQQVIGYGLKVPVSWPRMGLLPDAQLLSYLESGEPVRIDATGGVYAEVQARGTVALAQMEALNRGGRNLWTSRTQRLRIKVRGLLPVAGNPLTGPGDADGSWLSARFRRPVGLAMLGNGVLVAADPEAHVLRAISPDREVTTLWGSAGDPGHQDGIQERARFRGPTFLAARPTPLDVGLWLAAPSFLVSDSGNHVVRAVDALGRVTTLAGTPGEKGHRDGADLRQARFNDPQGLAVDSEGRVYLADRGNHVIRVITPGTGVTTLAGKPGEPGSRDGAGAEARFRDLKGLALGHPIDGVLTNVIYVVDGHSVRRVSLDGEVATLCGDPAVPGSIEPGAGPLPLAGRPCLDQPHGLAVIWPRVYIADRGNHAIQVLRPRYDRRMELAPLVGDRALAATRFGLLRFGLPGPLGPDYGALEDPMGLAADPWGDLYIADSRCIVQCSEPMPPEAMAPPALHLIPGGGVARGLALEVAFSGPRPADPDDVLECPPHYFWKLECSLPDGSPATGPVQGEVRGRVGGSARVTFEDRGEVDVRLTCVSADGHSSQDTVRIRVD
ncbi:MAG: hypothetical protein P4L36_08920 [Holophaga sp.]|nr:hypothetical protein [Holophaga sp.]